jgi:hypothetical protein
VIVFECHIFVRISCKFAHVDELRISSLPHSYFAKELKLIITTISKEKHKVKVEVIMNKTEFTKAISSCNRE